MKDAEISTPVYTDLKSIEIKGWLDEDGEPVKSAVLEEGAEPLRPKKETPQQKQMKLFERAWWAAGHEDIDGSPYVTRSALQDFIVKNLGKSKATATNYSKASYPNGIIGILLDAGMIVLFQDGWIIFDNAWASVLMVQKGSKKDQ